MNQEFPRPDPPGNRTVPPRRILPVIILSQFFGTSLWFASNAVLPELQSHLNLHGDLVGITTSAVQFGFILGTLGFSFFGLPDRLSPRILFAACSLAGALFNALVLVLASGLPSLIVLRFLTGVALAGIYPVGMKIAAGWYREGLGNALGFLVGALVLGTSFPHLLKSAGPAYGTGSANGIPWEGVILAVSIISALGGILMYLLVPDGPWNTQRAKFDAGSLRAIFRTEGVRSAAFGYFGHMWELYTFYAFLPFLLSVYRSGGPGAGFNTSLWAFAIIAAGSLGCAGGGIASNRWGSARVALAQLALSGACCIVSPLFFRLPVQIFLAVLLHWGIVVVGDSPQFSAMVARYAPSNFLGSALTIVNCIGFAITIVSIEVTSFLSHYVGAKYLFLFLALGPAIGLFYSRQLLQEKAA